jgi:hypothetical protein
MNNDVSGLGMKESGAISQSLSLTTYLQVRSYIGGVHIRFGSR